MYCTTGMCPQTNNCSSEFVQATHKHTSTIMVKYIVHVHVQMNASDSMTLTLVIWTSSVYTESAGIQNEVGDREKSTLEV